MTKELEQKLYDKYPKIFAQKDLSIQESCMPWGIDCRDGWYKIIDRLCSSLQWDIDHNNEPQLEATQVKEKFGGLRFYTNVSSNRQDGMISIIESLSEQVCEYCGSMEDVFQTKGWITTICKECNDKRKEK